MRGSAMTVATDSPLARAGSALLGDVVILVRDTVTVFVRLFPQILAVFLLGWLGDAVAVRVAAIVGDTSGWAAVVIFSSSFLFTLVAVVVTDSGRPLPRIGGLTVDGIVGQDGLR